MTLTERQAFDLEMEFLNADLGRLPSEMPVTTIKRELTRALYERPSASAQEVISWVVTALDKVVTAWEGQVVAKAQPQVVDGVRTAASIIVSAAERAGLATLPAGTNTGRAVVALLVEFEGKPILVQVTWRMWQMLNASLSGTPTAQMEEM